MKQKSCFGKLYDSKARECQTCESARACWESIPSSCGSVVDKSGQLIAIQQIIAMKNEATVNEISEELKKRFGEKDSNIYYYLGKLKERGMVNVKIKGRQRLYSLR